MASESATITDWLFSFVFQIHPEELTFRMQLGGQELTVHLERNE